MLKPLSSNLHQPLIMNSSDTTGLIIGQAHQNHQFVKANLDMHMSLCQILTTPDLRLTAIKYDAQLVSLARHATEIDPESQPMLRPVRASDDVHCWHEQHEHQSVLTSAALIDAQVSSYGTVCMLVPY